MEKVLIIGSGPAGYTAALYCSRANLNPLCLEGELSQNMLPGGQLMTTTEVENFPGYPDGVSGPAMMDEFKRQAEKFGTRFAYKTATAVDFTGSPLKVFSGDEAFEAEAVIIATGASAKYLGIPSEQVFLNRGVSACATCDGALPRFRNRPVVVVGGGDTAMEEALFLAKFASRVHVVHRRDKFRASPIMAGRVTSHPKITVEWNSVAQEIIGNDADGVTGVILRDVTNNTTRNVDCSGYFAAIGHKPNTDIFVGVLDLDDTGYIVARPDSTYTKIPGVFACGNLGEIGRAHV